MNRTEFMKQLEMYLSGMPKNERDEALKYYIDYFNDAGPENEQSVIAEFGSPKQVADTILKEFGGKTQCDSNTTYTTYANTAYNNTTYNTVPPTKEKDNAAKILGIVLTIVLFPVWFPILASIFGVLFGFFMAAIAVFIAFACVTLVLILVGLLLVILGIMGLFSIPVGGLWLAGVGAIMMALGILFLLATIWLFGKALPAMIAGIGTLWKKIFKKKEEV